MTGRHRLTYVGSRSCLSVRNVSLDNPTGVDFGEWMTRAKKVLIDRDCHWYSTPYLCLDL